MADQPVDPNSTEALAARSAERIAKMRGESGPKEGDDAKGKGQGAGASDGGDAAAATTGDKPAGTPEGASDQNLSHIPEKYRAAIASLPPEVRDGLIEWTKGGTTRHTDVTKWKKQAEDAEKRAKANESKAAAWDDFASDRRRVEAMLAYDKKLKAGAAADVGATVAEEDAPDYPNMTPAQIEAHVREVARKAAVEAAKEAREAAIKDVEAKFVAPMTRTQACNAALAQYALEHGIDHNQIKAATDAALAWSEAHVPGFTRDGITADNVVGFIEPFLPKSGGTAQAKPKADAGSRNGAGVATPSRGGAAVAPSPVPAWVRESRPPSKGERLGAIAATIERLYGRRVSEAEVGEAVANGR